MFVGPVDSVPRRWSPRGLRRERPGLSLRVSLSLTPRDVTLRTHSGHVRQLNSTVNVSKDVVTNRSSNRTQVYERFEERKLLPGKMKTLVCREYDTERNGEFLTVYKWTLIRNLVSTETSLYTSDLEPMTTIPPVTTLDPPF